MELGVNYTQTYESDKLNSFVVRAICRNKHAFHVFLFEFWNSFVCLRFSERKVTIAFHTFNAKSWRKYKNGEIRKVKLLFDYIKS